MVDGKPPLRRKGRIKITPREEPEDVQVPMCPDHAIPMKFSMDKFAWVCANKKCQMMAYPESELERGRPILGRGEVEVLRIHTSDNEWKTLLRAKENNVFIDVTDIATMGNVSKPKGDESPVVQFTIKTTNYVQREERDMK